MLNVSESVTLDVSAERAWGVAGPFEGLHVWHPVVTHTDMTDDAGTAQRILHLDGGGELVENYDAAASSDRVCAWTLVTGPFPVRNYSASVTVSGDATSATVTWAGSFEADGVSDDEAREMIAGAYRAGLDQLPGILG